MTPSSLSEVVGVLVEHEVQFTLVELSRVCQVDIAEVVVLVDEGVLSPKGSDREQWLFGGDTLRRARKALRLIRDLELNPGNAALVLDLLDEIDVLRGRLRQLGEL